MSAPKRKIAVTTSSFAEYDPQPAELLKQSGFEVVFNKEGRTLKPDEITALLRGCCGVVAGTEKYDRRTIEELSMLKLISRCGTGIENVDILACRDRGIRVLNTPDAPTRAVAELTVGLILDLLRKVSAQDRRMRSGKWEKSMGHLLFGKKVAIIGFGRIGQMVSHLLKSFGAEIGYFDVRETWEQISHRFADLPSLLKWADIVTLHAASLKGVVTIIGDAEIRMMPKGSWIVNVSRGGLIDEAALFTALSEGHLSGAALDVFSLEPYSGPLKGLDNVILTPHIGSYAQEARTRMELEAVQNLISALKDISE